MSDENAGELDESAVASIVNEFTDRLNRGEQPDLQEYISRNPSLADVIRVFWARWSRCAHRPRPERLRVRASEQFSANMRLCASSVEVAWRSSTKRDIGHSNVELH